jgi:heme/copper-type cytochrome/quinol oxidase subunit 2
MKVSDMPGIQLPADFGYDITWLTYVLIALVVVTTVLLAYVFLTTRSEHYLLRGKDRLKYKLHKYHAERYWGIFIAGALVWLFFLGTKFEPVASVPANEKVHVVDITAGQWFWRLSDKGVQNNNPSGDNKMTSIGNSGQAAAAQGTANSAEVFAAAGAAGDSSGPVKVKAGETVKFVARSVDVNHGFGLLKSSKQMDTPLLQMQVIPGFDNVFYYTFKEPGTYTIRCLEYCGWSHPFMVSQITIEAA